jgi:hypothetical protein
MPIAPILAVQKVGHFVKTTGAKIAKFGLEVVSTAASIGSKIAKFIPVVGKAVSTALNVESKVTGLASNAIHVDLGAKLDKGMQIMNKIQHPVSEYHRFFLSEYFGQNIDLFVRRTGGALGAVVDALRRDGGGELVFRREVS